MFLLKAIVSGLLIALASELGRRSPALGGMVSALPLVSLITLLWIWRGGATTAELETYARSNFWFVLPTIPLFLVFAALLKGGWSFWPALAAAVALTLLLYVAMMALPPRLGIRL
jgi:F0F1-type ATP synthase assembly protein I